LNNGYGKIFNVPGGLAIYVIEKEGVRMMIDTPTDTMARKFVKRLNDFDLIPIHKILLTHSHWDHMQSVGKLKKLMKDTEIEVLASENAIPHLKDPEKYNMGFEMKLSPIEDVTPLKEGDIIDLNGLKLKILNFFGHSQDLIGILDENNRNLFISDAIGIQLEPETFIITIMPPEFNETELFQTFQKLRNLRDKVDSISFPHFGVYTGNEATEIIDRMEEIYLKVKDSLINWYNENPSIDYIVSQYYDTYTPNSTVQSRENPVFLKMILGWSIDGMKLSGFIS
jgi:glyoxylase-like metal-dependent hydrolase (beta-lactamase superfamily II)